MKQSFYVYNDGEIKRKDNEEDCYSIKRHAFHGSMRKRKRRSERS